MIDASSIAETLGGKRSGNGWMCRCPAHDDEAPSLAVTDGNSGRPIVHCFGGCEFGDVVSKLKTLGIWPDASPEQKLAYTQRKQKKAVGRAEVVMALVESDEEHGISLTNADQEIKAKAEVVLAKAETQPTEVLDNHKLPAKASESRTIDRNLSNDGAPAEKVSENANTGVSENTVNFVLRDYQQSTLTAIRKSWSKGHRRIGVMLPTGSGKTNIAMELIKKLRENNKSVAFIVDRLTLIKQTSKKFDEAGITHGIIQGDNERYRPWSKVQICSIQTLASRGVKDVDFFIVDEFHSVYEALTKLMSAYDLCTFIGFSATPFTAGLHNHWDDLVIGVTTQQLIDQGYLVPFTAYGPPGPDLSNVQTVAGDYHQTQLAAASDKPKLVADIVMTWLQLGEDQQTICFATNIAHSKHIVAEFMRNGVAAAHIDCYSDSDERSEILKRFHNHEIRIVSSVDVLTKGYDNPDAACLIQARATKSLIVHIQQIGRVLRIAEGKQYAIILDHGGNHARLGFATDALPDALCCGDKAKSKSKPKDKPLPKPCPSCHYLKEPGQHECPQCGFKPERLNTVEVASGELQELEKGKTVTKAEKQIWFSMFLYYANSKMYSAGWAAHKYREKFGVWPRSLESFQQKPTAEFVRWIKYLQIKYAKSKHVEVKTCGIATP